MWICVWISPAGVSRPGGVFHVRPLGLGWLVSGRCAMIDHAVYGLGHPGGGPGLACLDGLIAADDGVYDGSMERVRGSEVLDEYQDEGYGYPGGSPVLEYGCELRFH